MSTGWLMSRISLLLVVVVGVLLLAVIAFAVRRARRRSDERRWARVGRIASDWAGEEALTVPAAMSWCRVVAPAVAKTEAEDQPSAGDVRNEKAR
jgi:hypothetical protein